MAMDMHWEFFLSVESDLERCARYVDFSSANEATYSLEFARIIAAAGGEIDVVAKQLCKQLNAASKADNINEYAREILAKYPKLPGYQIHLPRFKRALVPWAGWSDTTPPAWWTGYNKVKHQRATHFYRANLGNALHIVAGLLVLLIYNTPTDAKGEVVLPFSGGPKIFDATDGNAPAALANSFQWHCKPLV